MNNKTIAIVVVLAVVVIGAIVWASTNRERDADDTDTTINTNSDMLNGNGTLAVKNEEVEYFNTTKGFYVEPEQSGSYPGVIMIHEWWGLNQNIKDMAMELSKEGYKVLAVDLFKGSVAETQEQAREQTSNLNQEEALNNLKAAKAFLQAKQATKIASFGWCFGGGQSMQLSVSGEPLDATVIYYGNLVTSTARLENIKWPVLGIFGETDTSIPTSTVREFNSALDTLGIENSINIYPGVGHAFANPSGQNYAPEPTKDAWSKTLVFLKENLKEN